MVLRPVSDVPLPPYPELPPWKRGLLRHLRRVTAVGATVGALWLGGCYGATPFPRVLDEDADIVVTESEPDAGPDGSDGSDVLDITDATPDAEPDAQIDAEVMPLPNPTPCEPDPRMSGATMPTNFFVCEWDDPPPPSEELPIRIGGGHTCAGGSAQAWYTIDERTRLRIGLLDYNESVRLTVMDSQGRVLTQLGPGESCLELYVEPDAVGLAVEGVGEPDLENQYFEFYIDIVGDDGLDPAS